MSLKKITVSTKKEMLGLETPIETYLVELSTEGGVWIERYTKSELETFLRGVSAGAALLGGMVQYKL